MGLYVAFNSLEEIETRNWEEISFSSQIVLRHRYHTKPSTTPHIYIVTRPTSLELPMTGVTDSQVSVTPGHQGEESLTPFSTGLGQSTSQVREIKKNCQWF